MGKIKNVFIPNKTPAATTFKVDDLIINAKDGKVFIKTTDNRVICINTSSIEDDDGKRLVTSEVTGSTITTLTSNGQGQISGTLGDGTFSVIDIGLTPGRSVTFADVKSIGNIAATGNIIATGDVIANRYIVSSSVSHITQSFSSGSTIFGDTINDTHQFTGSISVSSSTFVVNGISTFNGAATFNSNVISLGEDETSRININGFSATRLYVKSNITASGNISASGTIIGSNISGTNTGDQDLSSYSTLTQLNASSSALQTNIDAKSSITQLNASSSALQTNINAKASLTQLNASSSALQTNIDAKASLTQLNASSSALQTNIDAKSPIANPSFTGHITASGNISSSGTIIAATLDAAAVSDTLAAAIVAEIDNDEIPIAKLAEDAVTVTAGTGLTGGGSITLGGSATLNVIGGTGVTANANDIAIGQDVATTANVQFANITSSANISSSGTITGNSIVGTIGTATQGTIDHDSLANFVANEHIDHSAVSVIAGTGLTGGGTIAANRTLNVIGGTGVTANANDIAIGQDVATTANVLFNHITASANISASGTITAATLDAAAVTDALAAAIVAEIDNDEIPIAKLAEDAVTVTAGTGLTGGGSITLGGSATVNVIGGTGVTANANDIAIGQDVATTANVQFANITSSANISSSGTITGNSIVGTLGTAAQTNITSLGTLTALIVDELNLNGNAISSTADGDVYLTIGTSGFDFEANAGDKFIYNSQQNNVDLQYSSENDQNIFYIDASADKVGIGDATPTAKLDVAGDINTTSHITASGNISSSGTIIAATLDAAAVSDTLAAAIVAEIDNDEIPIAKLAEDAVTVTAGTGLTGGGSITLGGSATVNVIGGTGVTANANDIAIGQDVATTANVQFANITSSANISASGNTHVFGNVTMNSGKTFIGNAIDESASENLLVVGGISGASIKLYSSHNGTNRDVGLHMSASENGQEYSIGLARARNSFYISPSDVFSGPENAVFEIDAVGNITASGNISSSGTITAATLVGAHTLTTAAQTNVTSVGTLSALTVSGDINANGNIVGDDGTDITNIESIFADNLVHDGDTDTKIAFGTNTVAIKAGNTTVFESSATGSVLSNVHQTIYDTGSLALNANSAFGDIVKIGDITTTAGGIYFLNNAGGWTLTQANAAATSTGSLAVAVGTNSTTHGMCLRGFVNPFTDPGAGIGAPVYLSDTHTGRMLATAPDSTNDVVRIIGYQYGTDLIYFNPSNDYIVHA